MPKRKPIDYTPQFGAGIFRPKPEVESDRTSSETGVPADGKKPAPLQRGKSINSLQVKPDKFDKYSTYLRPGYKKQLKSIALERDCKDYEVLDEALTLFFNNRKK